MKHKKVIAAFTLCFILLFALSACDPTVTDANSSDKGYEQNLPSSPDDVELFAMEYVGVDDHFRYYRDTITDVIYIKYESGQAAGLTVMLDPETGLPLTYMRYMELANQKTP